MADPAPITATPEALAKALDRRPVLWVGAGVSAAAGHPGTGALVAAMVAAADDPIDPGLSFEQVADAFVASQGAGALGDLLQRELGGSRELTALHRAIARAAGAGSLAAIVTTNYDDLLERALGEAEVRFVLQSLEDNAVVVDAAAPVRLLKLHGSRDDWSRVILSGRSYASFGRSYPFLGSQLDVLLRQHPVLFVGCSLQDPRIGDWLDGLDEAAAAGLKEWRALVTARAWEAAVATRPGVLRAPLRPLVLADHAQLQALWAAAVPALAPAGEMAIELEVGRDGLEARLDGAGGWRPGNPLDDPDLIAALELLQQLGTRALPADDHGTLGPAAAHQAALLRERAAAVGERLTGVLSEAARARLAELEAAARSGTPALVRVQVAVAAGGDPALADRLLALPWELLRVGGRFPVEEHTVDLVREAVVPGAAPLAEPDAELSVVATVAAPVDQVPVDHEEEMYRLWRALGARHEGRLRVADLGTLEDLAAAVEKHRPPVVHFTGHGEPGALVFEDGAARSVGVAVGELVKRLRTGDRPLPRLIYLSACHGTTAGGTAAPRAGARQAERMVDVAAVATRPSTAASLHRGGFGQVVGYFGPVGDFQATRVAAAFYGGLAQGRKARSALRAARELAARPLPLGDGWGVYPLGWAQLALYHRGADVATALAAAETAPVLEAPPEREFERLDRTGESQRVERRHDVPIVGVQQLRHGFIGRRSPRAAAVRRWREGQRVLVVQGLGGLGKTALCGELLRLLPSSGTVLALDGRHAGAQPDPLAGLWKEVQAARPGDAKWSGKLAELQKDGLTPEALVRAVGELCRFGGGLVVYLDDAESLQEAPGEEGELGRWRDERLRAWWDLMLAMAADHGQLGVLVSSRYRPEGTPERAVLPLEPMSRWETVRLMAWMPTLRRLPHADRQWLAEQLAGHPRTVEWLEVLAAEAERRLAPPGGRFTGDWRTRVLEPILAEAGEKVDADLLLEQVWGALDATAQEHLGRASVLNAPVPWEAILHLEPEGGAGSGRRLIGAGLLSPFQSAEAEPWWAPHRLVSEMAARRWSGDRVAAHRRIGGWFAERFGARGGSLDAQRAVEHLCIGMDPDRAWPAAQALAISLRGAGRYREAFGWVERVLEAGPSGPRRGLALLLRTQLLVAAGILPAEGEADLLEALELVEPANRGHVLHELGAYCRARGRLGDAARFLRRAVEAKVAEHGERSSDAATSLYALALVLHAQGDLAGARRHLEQVLEVKAAVYGNEEHPEVAPALHALAGVLQAQGDLAGARQRLERSLEIKAAAYGTEQHPGVAASLHSLAAVLQGQGDLAGARRHVEHSLEILAAVHGTEVHPEVANSLQLLAEVLQDQGDLVGARRHLERSLEIRAAVYGTEEHPDVAMSLNSLAGMLRAQGDLAGARQHLERSLEICAAVYGTREHYLTAVAEGNLGMLLVELGEAERGKEFLLHALDVYRAQLGPDHPKTSRLAEILGGGRDGG